MGFSQDDVKALAQLAHIELRPEQAPRVAADLERLLAYIALIQAIDVDGVSETAHLGCAAAPLREDVARPGLRRDVLTRDAPAAAHGLFEVPRVVTRSPARGEVDAGPEEPEAADEVAP